jgi:monofunctional glycosyltransferase
MQSGKSRANAKFGEVVTSQKILHESQVARGAVDNHEASLKVAFGVYKRLPKRHARRMGKTSVKPKPRTRLQLLLRVIAWSMLIFLVISVILVIALRWFNPPTTGIRLYRWAQGQQAASVDACWISLRDMGPNLPMAVIAGEDQRFESHHGFDIKELKNAINSTKKKRRGASTISQQVAKNVFLWPGRSYVRKALEAYFTVLIEVAWSKKRILEMHLNVVEYGDGLFGACAGTRVHFNKVPAQLSAYQAALLAASLPNPHIYKASKPNVRLSRRATWITKQMNQLGGAGYLARLR